MTEFDKENRYFDEGYPPVVLEEILQSDTNNKSSFVDQFFTDSYRLQVKTLLDLNPSSCLELGPGEHFTRKMLCDKMEYKTADLFGDPDFKIDFRQLREGFLERKFDVVCAFQVLEHLPLNKLAGNLMALRSVSSSWVLISLPYYRFGFSLSLNVHLGQRKNYGFDVARYWPYFKKPNRKYRQEYMELYPWAVHYFELGRGGVSDATIEAAGQAASLNLVKKFDSKNPFHRFFLFSC